MKKTSPDRVYVDTSVYGGVFDRTFSDASRAFFNCIERGKYELCTSNFVEREIRLAPELVRSWFDHFLPISKIVSPSPEALRLQQSYLHSGIVSRRWEVDAMHVALASVNNCSTIVSWNFKHIVHHEKIVLYNRMNQVHGYNEIAIHSPPEMLDYEDQN